MVQSTNNGGVCLPRWLGDNCHMAGGARMAHGPHMSRGDAQEKGYGLAAAWSVVFVDLASVTTNLMNQLMNR